MINAMLKRKLTRVILLLKKKDILYISITVTNTQWPMQCYKRVDSCIFTFEKIHIVLFHYCGKRPMTNVMLQRSWLHKVVPWKSSLALDTHLHCNILYCTRLHFTELYCIHLLALDIWYVWQSKMCNAAANCTMYFAKEKKQVKSCSWHRLFCTWYTLKWPRKNFKAFFRAALSIVTSYLYDSLNQ